MQGFRSAPERTRTSTDHKVHKALDLGRALEMLLLGSESSKLRRFLDGLDGMDALDVATGVATGFVVVASTGSATTWPWQRPLRSSATS
jgi:hypothetical protein